MTIRIFVLALVAALCLVAAAPKSHDVDGDGYGPQMVAEKAAPRTPYTSGSSTTALTFTTPSCGTLPAYNTSLAWCTTNGVITIVH